LDEKLPGSEQLRLYNTEIARSSFWHWTW